MKRLPAAFYALPSGREPVREWLRSLDRDDRVLFCIRQGQMVLLDAFLKKTQKTPSGDRDLALRRMKEIV